MGGSTPSTATCCCAGPARWCALTVVIAVCTAFRRYAAFAISLRAETDLRRQLFAHLQRLHFAYHDRAQTGELMSRANTDLRQIQLFLVFVPVAGANIVMIVGVAAVLVTLNAKLALLALLPLPLLNIVATWFSRRMHPQAADLQERLADVSGVVEESLSGHPGRKGVRRRGAPRRQAPPCRRGGGAASPGHRSAPGRLQPDDGAPAHPRAGDRPLSSAAERCWQAASPWASWWPSTSTSCS